MYGYLTKNKTTNYHSRFSNTLNLKQMSQSLVMAPTTTAPQMGSRHLAPFAALLQEMANVMSRKHAQEAPLLAPQMFYWAQVQCAELQLVTPLPTPSSPFDTKFTQAIVMPQRPVLEVHPLAQVMDTLLPAKYAGLLLDLAILLKLALVFLFLPSFVPFCLSTLHRK
jgi:hypothetical protein